MEALDGLESTLWIAPAVRRLRAMAFPLATLLILLLGVLLVYLLFVRPDAFNEWFAVKPGVLVDLTDEAGRLQVQPFEEPANWYEWSINFHSNRWGATLLFLSLQDVTGLGMRNLSVAPFGIVLVLLAMLFVFSSGAPGSSGRWGFLLSSLLLLLSWPMLGWSFHSGAWPALTMGLLFLGLLLASRGRQRHQMWFRGLAILFLFLTFSFYHAMAVLLVFLLPVMLAYRTVAPCFSHRSGQNSSAPAFSYMNITLIALVWFFLDPLFSFMVGETGVTRPWEGMESFYRSFFQRSGDVATYQLGYSFTGRVMLMLPLVALFLTGAWLWVRTHAASLIRGRPLSEAQVIAGAFFLAVPILFIAAVISGAGAFRYPEMYLLLLLAVPLMLMQWLFSRDRLTPIRTVQGTLIAGILLIITVASFAVLARQPISRWGRLEQSDVSAAAWAARNIEEPYFADNFTTGLILLEDPSSPIVPLEGNTSVVGEAIYNGRDRFASELRAQGAQLALLNGRSVAAASPEHGFRALKTTDFFIEPIPNYDYDTAPFGRVYDDGRNSVITLGLSAEEPLPLARAGR